MTTLWRLYVRLFHSPNGVRFISIREWQLELLAIRDGQKKSFSLFNDLATSSKSRSVTRTRNARTTKLVKCVKDGDKKLFDSVKCSSLHTCKSSHHLPTAERHSTRVLVLTPTEKNWLPAQAQITLHRSDNTPYLEFTSLTWKTAS